MSIPASLGRTLALLSLAATIAAFVLVVAGETISGSRTLGDKLLWGGFFTILLAVALEGAVWRSLNCELSSLRSSREVLESRLRSAQYDFNSLIAGASHDLSQPLTVLHCTLELALLSSSLPQTARDTMEEAIKETRRAMTVTRLLRDLAEEDGASESFRPISLHELLEDMRQFFDGLAQDRGVRLVLDYGPDFTVLGDCKSLKHSVLFLLNNSLERSLAGGTVKMSQERIASSARIVVFDQGPVIPRDQLPHWFELSYLRHPVTNQGTDRLRLALVKRALEACGGTIAASASAECGSHFFLELPLAPPAAPTAPD